MTKKSTSMRAIIIMTFIMLLIITNSIILILVCSNWRASVEHSITNMEISTNNDILNKIESLVNLPLYLNETNYHLIKKGIIDINDKKEREAFFAGIMKTNQEHVYSFSYGTNTGAYYGARKNLENEIEIMQSDRETEGKSTYYALTENLTAGEVVERLGEFDPRTRDWYRIAEEKGKPVFSPIYKHFVMDDLALSTSYPIYNDEGTLMGVLGTHFTLSKINNFLEAAVKDKQAIAYIIEKDSGAWVANSLDKPNFVTGPDQKLKRMTIEEIDHKEIVKAYLNYQNNAGNNHIVETADDKLHVNFTDYQHHGLDWVIITAIPEGPFTARITQIVHLTVLLSVLAIVIATIIYIKITKFAFQPIYDLINTSAQFSGGNFTVRAKVVRDDEVGKLSQAFNDMAELLSIHINSLEEKVRERTKELENTNLALKRSEGDIRLLLDSTAEAIYGIDLEGNCTFCNASCLRVLGYQDQNELIGKNMHWQIHYKCKDGTPYSAENCKIFQAFIKGEGSHVDDEVFWRADGTSFPVEYYSYPQFRDGQVVGAVVTFTDITERLKVKNELINAKLRAEAANKAKSEFLATMSHEIRTPMNGIIGFLQILEQTELNDKQKEYINTIKTSTDTLLAVINDILDISKIEAGKLELERILFDIRETVETTVHSFTAQTRKKGLELNVLIRSDIPQFALGDPTKLRQVLGNVINNAVKFTDQGEVFIEVSLNKETETGIELLFTIKDTGIGMTTEEISKLFKPFTQVDSSSARKYGGTGLGLAICKSIVEMMQGKIDVASEKGKGTKLSFTVFLEKSGEEFNKIGHGTFATKDTTRDQHQSGLKILLAEDNEINIKVFVELLKKAGFGCDLALNGEEAVRACLEKEYDLIFMDCQMPVLDGYEATRQIRKIEGKGKHPVIIAITAYAMESDVEKCFQAGMDDFLSKPFRREDLMNIIKKYEEKYENWIDSGRKDYFSEIVLTLMEESDFDQKTCEDLIKIFSSQAEKLIKRIKDSIDQNNLNEADILVHQLKGSAGNVRAKEIWEQALKMEEALKTSQNDMLANSLRKIERLLKAIREKEEEDSKC